MRWFTRGDRVSASWLADQRRQEIDRSAEFDGVCWTRPYDQYRDGNGMYGRIVEDTRRSDRRRKDA